MVPGIGAIVGNAQWVEDRCYPTADAHPGRWGCGNAKDMKCRSHSLSLSLSEYFRISFRELGPTWVHNFKTQRERPPPLSTFQRPTEIFKSWSVCWPDGLCQLPGCEFNRRSTFFGTAENGDFCTTPQPLEVSLVPQNDHVLCCCNNFLSTVGGIRTTTKHDQPAISSQHFSAKAQVVQQHLVPSIFPWSGGCTAYQATSPCVIAATHGARKK